MGTKQHPSIATTHSNHPSDFKRQPAPDKHFNGAFRMDIELRNAWKWSKMMSTLPYTGDVGGLRTGRILPDAVAAADQQRHKRTVALKKKT